MFLTDLVMESATWGAGMPEASRCPRRVSVTVSVRVVCLSRLPLPPLAVTSTGYDGFASKSRLTVFANEIGSKLGSKEVSSSPPEMVLVLRWTP